MRLTISPEQLKFFHLQGYLELESLLSDEEAKSLINSISTIRIKIPGYPDENCFRSIPLILSLARKRGWGQLASDLIHKKPIRIAYDKFWASPPVSTPILDQESCGLLIDLHSCRGTFFKEIPANHLYKESGSCYFLIVLTTKHLPETLNPLIIR